MKKIFNKIPALAMAAAAAFLPSCTDNIENSETPVFPEKVKLDVTPGGSVTVSFTANMDWSASLQSDEDAARYFAIEDEDGAKAQVEYRVQHLALDEMMQIAGEDGTVFTVIEPDF